MTGIRDALSLDANALTLRAERGNVLASNIANAATPNFKARDFDFSAALAQAQGQNSMALQVSQPGHIAAAPGMTGPDGMGYRVPVSPALDGNTVEIGVEQMQFAENTTHYQASLTLLNRRIGGLMSAIKGE